MDPSSMALGGTNIGADLGNMFTPWKNPASAAMPYLNQMQSTLDPYYRPYINAGQGAITNLQGQYGKLLSDPGSVMNNIGQSYRQSPGFQFSLQQALQAANHAAAAGGMAGSPQAVQQNMQLATNLGNQDFNNYLSNALAMYGQGLSGEQDMFHTGYDASNEMGQSMGNDLLTQAMMAYQGQNLQNNHNGSIWGSAANLLFG